MKETYKIKGMTCQSCVNALDKEIKKIHGLKDIEVNLLTNTLTFDNIGNVNKDVIINSIRIAGYDIDSNEVRETKNNNLLKSLIINIILLIILMYIAMGEMIHLPTIKYLSIYQYPLVNALVQLLLTTIIIFNHLDYLKTGIKRLFKSPSMESLITVGSLSALFYGIFSLIMLMIAYTDNNTSLIHEYSHNFYFESAAAILVIVRLGKFIENKSKDNTKKEVERLLSLVPTKAIVLENDIEVLKDIEEVAINDIVIVKKGSVIPSDGIIIEGEGLINQANLTGESIPLNVRENDNVLASSYLLNGYLKIRVNKLAKDSNISKIVELVNEASISKSHITKLVDKVSLYFVPTIFIISILTFIINYLISKDFSLSFNFMISTLVIACPCALGLATPICVMVGSLKAAKNNILFKNIDILEKAKKIDIVVLDKTGTITKNILSVKDINIYENKYNLDEIKGIIYSLESKTNHPIAHSLVEYTKDYNNIISSNFNEYNGLGVSVVINDITYYIGNINFLKNYNLDTTSINLNNVSLELFLFTNEHIIASIILDDIIKENIKELIDTLHNNNIKVVMLTGDNEIRANYIKNLLNIDECYSNVLPKDKSEIIKELKKDNLVAMVGDGVNDSIALKVADIGISVKNATEIAIDSSDVFLLDDDVRNIYNVIRLSKRVFFTIKTNLFWAFIYNIIGIIIASGLLYYNYNIKLNPMYGSIFMSLSSIFVVTNALTINLLNLKKGLKKSMEIKVPTMMCEHCKKHIYDAVANIAGVKDIDINVKKKKVSLSGDFDINEVINAINNAGYECKL